ncbi:hypothetical protein C4L39_22585 [Clostridium diolis]|nr:hypothetical protein C4L39_22585 [Clostridium diolis]
MAKSFFEVLINNHFINNFLVYKSINCVRMVNIMNKYCFVEQEDKKDCGIAALATILMYHNKNYSVKKLKGIMKYDRTMRVNLFQLYDTAINLGFESKGVILESVEAFKYIKLPCIAQIEINKNSLHFIVLYEIKKNLITISDPSSVLKTILLQNFLDCFTGKILMIYLKE